MSVKLSIIHHIDGPTSGFNSGEFIFNIDGREISAGKEGCMIYISISDLIDGLLALEKKKSLRFVPVDTYHPMIFKLRGHKVEMTYKEHSFKEIDFRNLVEAVYNGVANFFGRPENCLQDSDSVASDLSSPVKMW